ncbi:hypothetical protein BO94DRAFT_285155 [Aspergillus sclerotioniger CBS 115572]|uniref:Transcription factor domain-containing protein n=1 Tax=Aspergillus sclerotioniger CBS 115572 TaxID=1450535 RepID=A0A317X918_9EURO|nr:hypothetical protein BO94DRAFT_285155 [Aspergillus sclerotioniger CBS 115572]PWY94815.1 hypothetical protein BO94DRAFT_285155 [Aspergillus sclerotioniger CBS 115572]
MDFVFINVKVPQDALQLAKEPEIRSHLARHQWRQHAENRSAAIAKRKREGALPICGDLNCVTLQKRFNVQSTVSDGRRGAGGTTIMSIPIPPPLGGLRVDPFRSYPIAWRPLVPRLVDHYLVSMAVDIPELDQPGNRGLLRTSWFPLVMTEPALFLVIMLLAASHHASVNPQSPEIKLNLLSLRCEAVRAVNKALGEQQGGLDDALVGAIAKMASYEAMFGSMNDFGVHMQGLLRAVDLRGGLSSLGLNGLLRRIVVWIDRNAAFLHGSMLYFPNATFVPGQPLPDPNPGHFLGAS